METAKQNPRVEHEIVGKQCLVLVKARQSILKGSTELRPGELATCEMVLDDIVGNKFAILNWTRVDVGECSIGVNVKNVRVWK
jgi:hypothetical protein